jgi:hypothetical protein
MASACWPIPIGHSTLWPLTSAPKARIGSATTPDRFEWKAVKALEPAYSNRPAQRAPPASCSRPVEGREGSRTCLLPPASCSRLVEGREGSRTCLLECPLPARASLKAVKALEPAYSNRLPARASLMAVKALDPAYSNPLPARASLKAVKALEPAYSNRLPARASLISWRTHYCVPRSHSCERLAAASNHAFTKV